MASTAVCPDAHTGACTFVLLAGLPGTGKSTLAAALTYRLSAMQCRTVVMNKDEVRAALFPGTAIDFSEAQNALCMDAMLAAAGYLASSVDRPQFILFDGRTFSRALHIEHVLTVAGRDVRAVILHLVCPDAVAEQRLSAAIGHPAANRSFALYRQMKQDFEPIARPHIELDTSRPLDICTEESLEFLLGIRHNQ